jgi:hypothetical protein
LKFSKNQNLAPWQPPKPFLRFSTKVYQFVYLASSFLKFKENRFSENRNHVLFQKLDVGSTPFKLARPRLKFSSQNGKLVSNDDQLKRWVKCSNELLNEQFIQNIATVDSNFPVNRRSTRGIEAGKPTREEIKVAFIQLKTTKLLVSTKYPQKFLKLSWQTYFSRLFQRFGTMKSTLTNGKKEFFLNFRKRAT